MSVLSIHWFYLWPVGYMCTHDLLSDISVLYHLSYRNTRHWVLHTEEMKGNALNRSGAMQCALKFYCTVRSPASSAPVVWAQMSSWVTIVPTDSVRVHMAFTFTFTAMNEPFHCVAKRMTHRMWHLREDTEGKQSVTCASGYNAPGDAQKRATPPRFTSVWESGLRGYRVMKIALLCSDASDVFPGDFPLRFRPCGIDASVTNADTRSLSLNAAMTSCTRPSRDLIPLGVSLLICALLVLVSCDPGECDFDTRLSPSLFCRCVAYMSDAS